MTEVKRYSLEDQQQPIIEQQPIPPQVPIHEQQLSVISPTPSTSEVKRSKTVRNKLTGGMKGFFNKNNKNKDNKNTRANRSMTIEENGYVSRPVLSSSASYGSPSPSDPIYYQQPQQQEQQHQQQQHQPNLTYQKKGTKLHIKYIVPSPFCFLFFFFFAFHLIFVHN
jgi:hypothetical protein